MGMSMIKRIIDLTGALLGLVFLSPVYLVVTWQIWRKLGPPVLFRQLRPGLNGRPFEMIKFRTMRNVVGADGRSLPDAARLTPFGNFLRTTSLDELPELWNVLKGNMSIVGPRPLLTEYLPMYSPQQARRHEVRPGITGWAQVNGRNALTWEDRFALDLWYVENQSLRLDLKIVLMSFGVVFKRRGINQKGSVTMEKFRGSV